MRLLRGNPRLRRFFLPRRPTVYLCYLDESGAPEQTGNTDHFVLLGLAIPDHTWKQKDAQVSAIKVKYGLRDAEIHTAWMARDYPEQNAIPEIAKMDWIMRARTVRATRALNLGRAATRKETQSLKKNYLKTDAYVHLTRDERTKCLDELVALVGSWWDARLFADAHWKKHLQGKDIFRFAFEQVVTRFNTYLRVAAGGGLGLLVQDNNPTEASRLTQAMRKFHAEGTLFAQIDRVIETPFFVDSSLTSMIQVADLCAYATRRFFDNGETRYFDPIRSRFDRKGETLVGLRHFTSKYLCQCVICIHHGRPITAMK